MIMIKRLFTIHPMVNALAVLLATLLSTTAFAQAKSPAAASSYPQASQELKLGSLNLETLKKKRRQAEAAKGLKEPVRKQVIDQLDRAISLIEETNRLEAEIQNIAKQVQRAPKKIKEIKTKLNQKDPFSGKKAEPAGASEMSIEKIEQRVQEAKAALAAAQTTFNNRQDQLAKLKTRPPIMQKEIADSKSRMQELAKEFEGIRPSGTSKALDESHRALLIAEHTKLLTIIRFSEQALLNHEVLLSLSAAELDLAMLHLKHYEAETQMWESIAMKRRQQQAMKARMEAETAKVLTPDLPPAVQKQYDINIDLGKTLEKLTGDEALTAQRLEKRKSDLKLLEEEFSNTRQRIQSSALSEMSGLTLRQRRQALPSPNRYRRDSKQRQLTMGQVSEAQFNINEQRRSILDLQNEKRQILLSISRESYKNLPELEDKIQNLLTNRRDLLEKLEAAYRRNYNNLQALEFTEQQLATKTEEYADFLNGHLLWIRSSKILGPKDLRNLPGAMLWMASPYNWMKFIRDLAGSFGHRPFVSLLGLLFAGTLFIGRHWSRRRMAQLSESVGRVKQDSFISGVGIDDVSDRCLAFFVDSYRVAVGSVAQCK
jgi:potassium efflux system protein